MSKWGLIDKSLEGRQRLYFPHWFANRVPTSPEANLSFRKKLHALTNLADRREIRKMCQQDFLFYVYAAVFIFEARGRPRPIPFLPYGYQIEVMTKLWQCLHDLPQQDLRIKKPRTVGATWMIMTLFEHAWHFMDHVQFLVGSRRAEEVDGTTKDAKGATPAGQWSKLLPKVDFIHLYQPSWLLPAGYRPRQDPHRTRNNIANPERGSLIIGESANEDFGRGGRFYGVGFDEHAHTDNAYDIIASCSQSSDCHFWWSSPKGPDTAFAMLGRSLENQIDIEWWMHPTYSESLTVDPVTKKRSSPWLVKKLEQLGHDPQLAANEVFADETHAVGCFYTQCFDVVCGVGDGAGTIQPPMYRGELDVIEQNEDLGPRVVRFCEQQNGRWLFWKPFGSNGGPECDDRYVFGIDVAVGSKDHTGRGASNSVIAVCGVRSGEIVAEFATHGLAPHELAREAHAAGWWFMGEDGRPALINFEINGPGGLFLDTLLNKYRYKNIECKAVSSGRMQYGWRNGRGDSNIDTSQTPFGIHLRYLVEGRLIERSQDCVEEMRHYQHSPRGAPVHTGSLSSTDPSGARENHGDRVTARVVICQSLKKIPQSMPDNDIKVSWGSIEHLNILEDREQRILEKI